MADAADDVLAVVETYQQLTEALAERRREIGLSQRDADVVAGLPDGYVSKLECGVRHLGKLSMPCLLQTLGVRMILVRDIPHAKKQRRAA